MNAINPIRFLDAANGYQRSAVVRAAVELDVCSQLALGKVTVELLDHHRRAIGSQTLRVPAGQTRFRFAGAGGWEDVRVRVGDFAAILAGPDDAGAPTHHLGNTAPASPGSAP